MATLILLVKYLKALVTNIRFQLFKLSDLKSCHWRTPDIKTITTQQTFFSRLPPHEKYLDFVSLKDVNDFR